MTTEKNKNNKPKQPFGDRLLRYLYNTAALAGVAGAVAIEVQYSPLQTRVFQSAADGTAFSQVRKSGPDTAAPAVGPFDERMGYTETLKFRKNMSGDFDIIGESTWLDRSILGIQLNPIYDEKSQAGLRIFGADNQPVFSAMYPRDVFENFDSIPPILVKSLLYVENRELLGEHAPTQNPAIEWDRFFYATIGYGAKKIGIPSDRFGGSTLATQLEKFKHYPDGRTSSPKEKFAQMLTASTRSYRKGTDTVAHRRQIVLEYMNSMPLASYPGFGEISGMGDGQIWFGSSLKDVSALLSRPEADLNDEEMKQAAKAYRQSLALIMAVKKPTAYLVKGRAELEGRIDRFLPSLVEAGIISPRMKEAVLAQRLEFSDPKKFVRIKATAEQKSVQGLQVGLMSMLDVPGLYELNRLDLSVRSTIDGAADKAAQEILRGLTDPAKAKAAGIIGDKLLRAEGVPDMTYSFTLYEKTADGNVLRIETDNFDGPLNLNSGTKQELGSTAKARVTFTYLKIMGKLHAKYAGMDAEALRAVRVNSNDTLTRWALEYLASPDNDKSLAAMIDASLERKYSGNPHETFFTGGGIHTFNNFKREENGGVFTVKQALHQSVNMPFVRMLRDIVHYVQSQEMNIDPDVYESVDSKSHQEYLRKFADAEGRTFQWKFWSEQKGKTPDEIATLVAGKTRGGAAQLAVVYRALFPQDSVEKMTAYIQKHCKSCSASTDYAKLYRDYAPGKFDLNDQGYIASVHPLELWTAHYKINNPDSTWEQGAAASYDARMNSYKWLLKSDKLQAQNTRISTMLEKEAFTIIHKMWKEDGFPFSTMVSSYASALGAAGDTPYGLAQFASIMQNDGVRKDPIKFTEIKFATDTPYSLEAKIKQPEEVRVVAPEIAQAMRKVMQGVVEFGTGRRIFNQVKLSDGRILPVGAKTGTGDNRRETYGAGGAVTSSKAVSRTATFFFVIDDRFYGCVTSYVGGEKADDHSFTSALSATVFKNLIPAIRPVLDRAYGVKTPEAAPAAPVTKAPAAANDAAPKTPEAAKSPVVSTAKSRKPVL